MKNAFAQLKSKGSLSTQFFNDMEKAGMATPSDGADYTASAGVILDQWISINEFHQHVETVSNHRAARVSSAWAEALIEKGLIDWETAYSVLARAMEIVVERQNADDGKEE